MLPPSVQCQSRSNTIIDLSLLRSILFLFFDVLVLVFAIYVAKNFCYGLIRVFTCLLKLVWECNTY